LEEAHSAFLVGKQIPQIPQMQLTKEVFSVLSPVDRPSTAGAAAYAGQTPGQTFPG